MHEWSLVKALIRQVDGIAREHDAVAVRQITIELGPLSGVEPELVRLAFRQVVDEATSSVAEDLSPRPLRDSWRNSLAENATLTIQEVPLIVRCIACDNENEVTDFIFRCDECGSGRVRVISGDEFRLLTITFDERLASV